MGDEGASGDVSPSLTPLVSAAGEGVGLAAGLGFVAGCCGFIPGGSPGEDPFCAVAGDDLVTGVFVVVVDGAFTAVGLGGGFGGAVG